MGSFHNDSAEFKAHDAVRLLHRTYIFDPSDGVLPAFQIVNHKAELSHELLSGAAAFAAAHEYEKYVAKNGKPENHARAKEIL